MTYYTKAFKYNTEFCSLIGANPNIKYTKTNIYNLLISHAKLNYKYFEFEGKLKDYLNKINPCGWGGYRKTNLMTMLNSLMISSSENFESKYVIISSNKSDIIIKELDIKLD